MIGCLICTRNGSKIPARIVRTAEKISKKSQILFLLVFICKNFGIWKFPKTISSASPYRRTDSMNRFLDLKALFRLGWHEQIIGHCSEMLGINARTCARSAASAFSLMQVFSVKSTYFKLSKRASKVAPTFSIEHLTISMYSSSGVNENKSELRVVIGLSRRIRKISCGNCLRSLAPIDSSPLSTIHKDFKFGKNFSMSSGKDGMLC